MSSSQLFTNTSSSLLFNNYESTKVNLTNNNISPNNNIINNSNNQQQQQPINYTNNTSQYYNMNMNSPLSGNSTTNMKSNSLMNNNGNSKDVDEFLDINKYLPSDIQQLNESYEKNVNINTNNNGNNKGLISYNVLSSLSMTQSSLRSGAAAFTPQNNYYNYNNYNQHNNSITNNNNNSNDIMMNRPRSHSLDASANEFNPTNSHITNIASQSNYIRPAQYNVQQVNTSTSYSASPPPSSRLVNVKSGTLSSNISSTLGNPTPLLSSNFNNYTPASAPTPTRSIRQATQINNANNMISGSNNVRNMNMNMNQMNTDLFQTPNQLTVRKDVIQQQNQLINNTTNRNRGENANKPSNNYPTLSFDHCESDHEMMNEKPDHMAYMFSFRTQTCEAFLRNQCPFDAYTCFLAHSKVPRRRKPILQHGRFNYIPTRCRYVSEDQECPQSVHCRFAHVTEEVIYHPSKYKTQMCSHQVDASGACTGYGMHCAKAHSLEDRRHPVYESSDDIPANKYTTDHFYDFVCQTHEREAERDYYQYHYKVNKCSGFPYNCTCDGLDWHRDEERRRGPDIRYAPMACPNVKPYLNAEWGDPRVDCSGRFKLINQQAGRVVEWDCEYAHTLLELMYHPQVYKTGLCDHFDENDPSTWKCVWKKRCAHSHGRADLRNKDEAANEWKEHLRKLPPLTNVVRSPGILNSTMLPGTDINAQQQNLANSNTAVVATTEAKGLDLFQSPTPQQLPGSPLPNLQTIQARLSTQTQTQQPQSSNVNLSSIHMRSHSLQQSIASTAGNNNGILSDSSSTWSMSGSFSASSLPLGNTSNSMGLIGTSNTSTPTIPQHTSSKSVSSALGLFDLSSPGSSVWAAPTLTSSNNNSISAPSSTRSITTNSAATTSSIEEQIKQLSINATHSSAQWFQSSTSNSSSELVTSPKTVIVSGGRLNFDMNYVAHIARDEYKIYSGLLMHSNTNDIEASISIKIINKNNWSNVNKTNDYSQLFTQLQQHQQLSRDLSTPNIIRLLEYIEENNNIYLVLEQHPGEELLFNACNRNFVSNQTQFQPLRLIQQLFNTIYRLHNTHRLIHGDINPNNINVDINLKNIRLLDLDRNIQQYDLNSIANVDYINAIANSQGLNVTEYLGRANDVYSAALVAYWLLSHGRLPFKPVSNNNNYMDWRSLELSNNLDTTMLSPAASHFILHILLTDASKRMTAEAALRHPIFMSPVRAMTFLATVANYITHHKSGSSNINNIPAHTRKTSTPITQSMTSNIQPPTEDRSTSYPIALDSSENINNNNNNNLSSPGLSPDVEEDLDIQHSSAVQDFCDELESLKSSILPAPIQPNQLDSSQSISGEWGSTLHATLFLRHMSVPGEKLDSKSVVSLLRFMSCCVDHLISAPLVSCHLHTLFHLDHLKNCPRPKKVNYANNPQEDETIKTKVILEAVADYFLPRFPSLLITVWHLTQKTWPNEAAFHSFFHGPILQ